MRGKRSLEQKSIVILLSVFTLIYVIISVQTHAHYQTFGWDLGYFDQLIWKISKGMYPMSSLSHVNLLAGHFTPVLYLYAPLYWIWSDPAMLLIVQAIVMVASSYPLYLLSQAKSRNTFFSFTIVIAYLLFIGTQWSILNEFHEATIIPLFLSLFFYALDRNRKHICLLILIGMLFVKEEMALLVASLGITLGYFYNDKKLGFIIPILSTLFFFYLVFIFMPKISETGTYYQSNLSRSAGTPVEFANKIFTDPFFLLTSFVTPPEKLYVLFQSIISFSLLPLFASFYLLVPVIEQFVMRFIYTGPQFTFWQNVNHHAAPMGMLLAVASIYAAVKLEKNFKKKEKKYWRVLPIIIIVVTITLDIVQKSPIHSIFKKQLYENADWMNNNNKIIQFIPSHVSLATQNSMFPHLSQRNEISLLPEINNAEYVVFDFVDGPNKFSPLNADEIRSLYDRLIQSGEYKIEKQSGEALLLKRTY